MKYLLSNVTKRKGFFEVSVSQFIGKGLYEERILFRVYGYELLDNFTPDCIARINNLKMGESINKISLNC